MDLNVILRLVLNEVKERDEESIPTEILRLQLRMTQREMAIMAKVALQNIALHFGGDEPEDN